MRGQYKDLYDNCGQKLLTTVVTLLLKRNKSVSAHALLHSELPKLIPEYTGHCSATMLTKYQRLLNGYFMDQLFHSKENTFNARHALVICSTVEDWLFHLDQSVIDVLP